MTHDPLCPVLSANRWDEYPWDCCCNILAKARSDERQKLHPAWWSQEYHAGYRQGYEDANGGKKAKA